jgi:hypothetical protein
VATCLIGISKPCHGVVAGGEDAACISRTYFGERSRGAQAPLCVEDGEEATYLYPGEKNNAKTEPMANHERDGSFFGQV